MNTLIDKIFLELPSRFQGPYPTNAGASERPLRALELITRLSTTADAAKSYKLFGAIMQSNVAQETKMKAARLALHAAYQPGHESAPPVGDPKHIFGFLLDHVGLHIKKEDRTYAVSSARCAIDSASNDPTSESWTWRIENADGLLTGFHQSPDPEEFQWWYEVLWLHYGGLDPEVQGRMDEIAIKGGDRVDSKRCRTAIENEIKRIKEFDGATNIETLEEARNKLSTFIDNREKVRDKLSGI